jgi:hypothetical protein
LQHDVKSDSDNDEKKGDKEDVAYDVVEDQAPPYDDNGKERVLSTAADFAVALCSLDDDPSMPIHTFRMWFIGLGLAVFGAVLGMLFQFRPQVISVSALFLQLIAFMLGKIFDSAIPGPGSRLHTGSRFWNFMNPGPFSKRSHSPPSLLRLRLYRRYQGARRCADHGQHRQYGRFGLLRVCLGRPFLRDLCQCALAF